MERTGRQRKLSRDCSGFTLLELLVVISILVAIAGLTVNAFTRVYSHTNDRLALTEMQAIAKAIRHFKADTGYYPGEGPFALSVDSSNNCLNGQTVTLPHNPCNPDCPTQPTGVNPGSVDQDSLPAGAGSDWFNSPASFWQLFVQPELCNNHPISSLDKWNSETGRGWRGPYLQGSMEFVDIGDGVGIDGFGDIVAISTGRLENIRGIADPFEHYPVNPGSYGQCEENEANTRPCLLDWRPNPDDGIAFSPAGDRRNNKDRAFETHGRPYLYFIDDADVSPADGTIDTLQNTSCTSLPCLMSSGPDGHYDPINGDDAVLNIQ